MSALINLMHHQQLLPMKKLQLKQLNQHKQMKLIHVFPIQLIHVVKEIL